MSHSDPPSVNLMFQMVACYLRETRHIKADTINQYISHMSTLLSMKNWVFAPHIRSLILARMLRGWARIDILRHPLRLTCHIPATLPVMAHFMTVADKVYQLDPRTCSAVKASAAVQYACAFRANEASPKEATKAAKKAAKLAASNDDPDDEEPDVTHHLKAAHCSFRFAHDPHYYPAHAGTIFPAGKSPTSFEILQATHKTSQYRGESHRSVSPNPNAGGLPFCALRLLWSYVQNFPPPSNGAFFHDLSSSHTTKIMKLTATALQLDDKRMSCRAIRSGSVTMLRNLRNKLVEREELEAIRDHGNWSSDTGERIYAHDNPENRKLLVAASLYDCGFMTVDYLRWYYMSPAV